MGKINRSIITAMQRSLKGYPVLVITGPRQSGKTTFLREQFSDWTYVNLEDREHLQFANNDVKGFLNRYSSKVIFDEAQNAQHLFSQLQVLVDDQRKMGQFILSGSQNFNLMERVSQSLAGRASLFQLFPLDIQELQAADLMSESFANMLCNGMYPAVFDRHLDPDKYFNDYTNTYVKRDVLQLINVKDNKKFTNFIKLCAARVGNQVNLTEMSRSIGVSHTTISNWLQILETSYIVFPLQPYFENYNKRLVKSPKLYFYDTGLLCHLLSIRNAKIDATHPLYGHIFENMVISEFHKQNAHYDKLRDFYYWRDSQGKEVDLLYKEDNVLNLFEIKSSTTYKNEMLKNMQYLESIAPQENIKSNLIYNGDINHVVNGTMVSNWRHAEY